MIARIVECNTGMAIAGWKPGDTTVVTVKSENAFEIGVEIHHLKSNTYRGMTLIPPLKNGIAISGLKRLEFL